MTAPEQYKETSVSPMTRTVSYRNRTIEELTQTMSTVSG